MLSMYCQLRRWMEVVKENGQRLIEEEEGLGVIEIVIIIIILIGLALLFQKEILNVMNTLLGRMGSDLQQIQPRSN